MAAREAESEASVKSLLSSVVHLPMNVLEDEGQTLSDTYRVGVSYPVFILIDDRGSAIARWTGYTGADRFIDSFRKAISELISVERRVARFKQEASALDAEFLARYFRDTGEFVKARHYLRLQRAFHGYEVDFSYQIFTLTAEAVWNDLLPFDSLLPMADSVLHNRFGNTMYIGNMAQIMARVARRTGSTEWLAVYLDAGIEATSSRSDQRGLALYQDLRTDRTLYVDGDTAEALRIKQETLGDGWEKDPARYFKYGEWCFKRGINLAEAETYIRRATDLANEDKFRATHLRLLSEIVFALGRGDEAVALAEEALALDPTTVYFEKKLAEMRASVDQ